MNDSASNYKIIDNYGVFKKASAPLDPDSDETILYADSNGDLIFHDGVSSLNISNISGSSTYPLTFVSELSDFPEPINGVIILPDLNSYYITSEVNLDGNRLQSSSGTALLGPSSETARISSTLGSGVPLISGIHSLSLRNLSLEVNSIANHIDLDGSQNSLAAIDWMGTNFYGGKVGRIKQFTNIILQGGAFFDLRDGITIEGTIGTVAFEGSLFNSISPGGTYLTIPSGTTISRRFRTMYSSLIVASGATGINFASGASVPTESYFLDTVNFAGAGDYIAGVDYNDNKANFSNCRGIPNSNSIGQYYISDNAVATTISNTTDFFKGTASTISGPYIQKFTDGNNRLTYDGLIQRTFLVEATVSVSGTSNNVVKFRIAKNGTTITASQVSTTLPAAGRSENVAIQAIVEMAFGDYVEIFVRNTTGANDVTLTDINLTCHPL